MIYLTNDRLWVEIAEPGERSNDTFRFDRAQRLNSEAVIVGRFRGEPRNKRVGKS